MKVKDPTGRTWRVTRRWVPWRRRLKGRMGDGWDLMPDGLGDDPISMIIFGICLVLIAPFVILALVAGVEFLLLLLLLPLAVLVRVVRARWTIEARRGYTIWWDSPSGGWGASRARIAEVTQAIARGHLPPQTIDAPKGAATALRGGPTAADPTSWPVAGQSPHPSSEPPRTGSR